jgi:hypothetical protein
MNWRAPRRWAIAVLVAVGLPVAAAAALGVADGTLGSGSAAPASCDSAPAVVQTVGTSSPNTTNIVSVDVAGIVSGCAGGTLKVSLYNGTDAVQEATTTIPAGGGTATVSFGTPVPLKESHLVAVSLQGP